MLADFRPSQIPRWLSSGGAEEEWEGPGTESRISAPVQTLNRVYENWTLREVPAQPELVRLAANRCGSLVKWCITKTRPRGLEQGAKGLIRQV